MKHSLEKNTHDTHARDPHRIRRAATTLVIIIILLIITLFAIQYTQQPDTTVPDPTAAAAQFLLDNTRTDITDADITSAGEFIQQTAEPTSTLQVDQVNAFLDIQPS